MALGVNMPMPAALRRYWARKRRGGRGRRSPMVRRYRRGRRRGRVRRSLRRGYRRVTQMGMIEKGMVVFNDALVGVHFAADVMNKVPLAEAGALAMKREMANYGYNMEKGGLDLEGINTSLFGMNVNYGPKSNLVLKGLGFGIDWAVKRVTRGRGIRFFGKRIL